MNTFSKAVVLGRLNRINGHIEIAITAQEASGKERHPTVKARMDAIEETMGRIREAQSDLAKLRTEIANEIGESNLPKSQYTPAIIKHVIADVRDKVRERFVNFPIAAALLETFILFFETDLYLVANLLSLRDRAACQDRARDHPQFYGVNGEPNAIGNREGKPSED